MGRTPAISVIMSVYNGRDYLAAAIDSVLGQTFEDFEFIIFDDGSTDRTVVEIVRQYASRDRRIIFREHDNRGLTATLNQAGRLAKAPLIARMDPDDLCMPDRFEKQVAFMDAHPEVVCCGSRVTLIDPYGVPIRQSDQPLEHESIDADLLRGMGWAIVHPVAMIRRDTLDRIGWYNEAYRTSQDMELWLRLAEVGRLANLPEPLLKYRQHLQSANYAKAKQQLDFKIRILTDAYARRGLPPFDASLLPPQPPSDAFESHRKWGWAALKAGEPRAARKHALSNLRQRPTSVEMWKLLLVSFKRRHGTAA